MRLFFRYIDREEEKLRSELATTKLELEKVRIDQESLSDEILAIERANDARIAASRKRGEKQRDKVERVTAILKSPTINRLAKTYCGEDLSVMRSKFMAEMQRVENVDAEHLRKKAANRKRYDDEVKDADVEVGQKIKMTREKLAKATETTRAAVVTLERRLEELNKKLKPLEEKELKASKNGGAKLTPWERDDLKRLKTERTLVEEQLASRKNQLQYGDVDSAQTEALLAEKRARSRFDVAAIQLRDADAIVDAERDLEQDIHNAAARFEDKSLDKVRYYMDQQMKRLSFRAEELRKRLDGLKDAVPNMDFMNAEEVEETRRKIARRLSEAITFEGGEAK